jgi:hypothetical protein
VHFDASPTLRFERLPLIGRLYTKNPTRFANNVRYGDIIAGLPIPRNSCSGIYCSHVLEHLALDEFHQALENTFQYLVAGGTFRLVVPDIERLARDYLDSRDAMRFIAATGMGRRTRPRGLKAIVSAFGNSQHLWMWDEQAMGAALRQHGFVDIRRAQFGDAEDSRFREVEEHRRFDGCLGMQCRRPMDPPAV